jgi:16S rRNA (guanine966-N2)-methyltransferase
MAKNSPRKESRKTSKGGSRAVEEPIAGMRIIGGTLRGQKLQYGGDLRTRPMKDRVREAIFNLVGPSVRGSHAIDLFAGTGALAFEAVSRGAGRATLIEQHHPTAKIIGQNAVSLGVSDRVEVVPGNTFVWWKMQAKRNPVPADRPWTVFCSPPYEFFISRSGEMLELIADVLAAAPNDSVVVIESDERFDHQTLPNAPAWDIRRYPPAIVAIYRKTVSDANGD